MFFIRQNSLCHFESINYYSFTFITEYTKSFMWTADREVNVKVIFTVMTTSWAGVKIRPEKNSGLYRIWTHYLCSNVCVCSSSICFGRASFADPGKNFAKHLHKAYLIDNLVFTLWLLFWWSLKRSESSVYFLRQLPCLISISFLLKVLHALHLVFSQTNYVFTCPYWPDFLRWKPFFSEQPKFMT